MAGFDELLAGLDPAVASQLAGPEAGNELSDGSPLFQADLDAFNAGFNPNLSAVPAPAPQAPAADYGAPPPTNQDQAGVPGWAAATSPSQVPLGQMRGGKRLGPEIRQIENETAAQANLMGDRERAGAAEQIGANEAAEAAQLASDAAKQGDTAAGLAAVNKTGEGIGVSPIQGTGLAARAAVQAELAGLEQKAALQDQAMVAAKRADYEGQLAKVGAMSIDPNQLVGSNPLAFGIQNMIGSIAAISGKPGMQNFATMMNDGLMKAIDRDVDAQINNLKNQQEVTAGFKTVYDMVANESMTHQEQRDRVYGAYLASVDSYLQSAQMGADTKVTQAAFGQARANIASKLAENLNKLDTDAMQEATTRTGQWLSYTAAKANTALGYAELAERKAAREAADKAAKAANDAAASDREQAIVNDLGSRAVVDPTMTHEDGGVAPVIGYTNSVDDGKKMDTLGISSKRLFGNVEKMRDLQKKIKDASAGVTVLNAAGQAMGMKALQSEAMLLARSIQEDLSYQIAQSRDPGGRVTDKDQESAKDMAILDPGYFLSDTEAVLRNILDTGAKAFKTTAEVLVREPRTQREYDYLQAGGASGIDSTKVAPGMSHLGKAPPEANEAEKIKATIDSQKSGVTSYDSKYTAKQDTPRTWGDYVADGGGQELSVAGGYKMTSGKKVRTPNWADEMQEIVSMAEAGDQDAVAVLEDLAGKDKELKRSGSGHDAHADEIRLYSRWILENLN